MTHLLKALLISLLPKTFLVTISTFDAFPLKSLLLTTFPLKQCLYTEFFALDDFTSQNLSI